MRHVLLALVLMTSCAALAAEPKWPAFSAFEYVGHDSITPGPGQYRNPILPGFHPDPSICRVGNDYYLVNSSFAWFPGVPVFHSTDLVHWDLIGHALDRPSQVNLDQCGVSEGVFAPTIRYHDGTFYLITTLVRAKGGGGNFYVTAKDPRGPWSEPVWAQELNGIDPSFFFDEDGSAYVVHNGPPPEDKPLYSGHRAIWMYAFDLATGKVKKETGKIIVNGGTKLEDKPVWIEGPHLLKREGWYYLIAAEGGTGPAHSEVAFRSKDVWGPYEPFEGNPILSQRQLDPKRPQPVTCVGHADFVQTPGGEWWAVFLGCRPYEGVSDLTNIGRETFLLPLRWQDGWPSVTGPKDVVPRVAPLPAGAKWTPVAEPFVWRDEFKNEKLAAEWNFLRLPRETWWKSGGGTLRIEPRKVELSSDENPSLVARRQEHAAFSASVKLDVRDVGEHAEAGLVAFQNEKHYLFLGVRSDANGGREVFLEQFAGSKEVTKPSIVASKSLPAGADQVELKVSAEGKPYSFFYRAGGEWKSVAEDVDGSILSTQRAGGFVGSYVGMFARVAR